MLAGRISNLTTILPVGLAYGLASLGCTLPVFLAMIGSSVSRR